MKQDNLKSKQIFSAIDYAHQIQDEAAAKGFEWADAIACFAKLEEEMAELKEATTPEEIEDELGDVLFCAVNYARMRGLEAGEVLEKACEKFNRRFQGMEKAAAQAGKSLSDFSLDELLDLWRQQKCL